MVTYIPLLLSLSMVTRQLFYLNLFFFTKVTLHNAYEHYISLRLPGTSTISTISTKVTWHLYLYYLYPWLPSNSFISTIFFYTKVTLHNSHEHYLYSTISTMFTKVTWHLPIQLFLPMLTLQLYLLNLPYRKRILLLTLNMIYPYTWTRVLSLLSLYRGCWLRRPPWFSCVLADVRVL